MFVAAPTNTICSDHNGSAQKSYITLYSVTPNQTQGPRYPPVVGPLIGGDANNGSPHPYRARIYESAVASSPRLGPRLSDTSELSTSIRQSWSALTQSTHPSALIYLLQTDLALPMELWLDILSRMDSSAICSLSLLVLSSPVSSPFPLRHPPDRSHHLTGRVAGPIEKGAHP